MELKSDSDDNLQVWHDPKLKPPKPFKTKIIRTHTDIQKEQTLDNIEKKQST